MGVNNLNENTIPQYYVMPAIVRPQWNLQIWSADCCVDGLDRHLCYPYGLIYVLCTNAHPLCTAISNIGMIQQLHLKIDLDFRIVHRWAPCYVPEFEERYVIQVVFCWGRHCGCVDARGEVLADWRVLSLCESHYRAAKRRKFDFGSKWGGLGDVNCKAELNFAPCKLPICRSFKAKPEFWGLEPKGVKWKVRHITAQLNQNASNEVAFLRNHNRDSSNASTEINSLQINLKHITFKFQTKALLVCKILSTRVEESFFLLPRVNFG